MKKIIALLLALVMALSLVACGGTDTPDTTPSTEPSVESTPAASDSAGASFTVVVTDLDGTESTFKYTSEAETVGEALVALELVSGDESDWGLMVTTVNGITADWATENAYWAFYIDGE